MEHPHERSPTILKVQVVDERREMRDAIVQALARRLPRQFQAATGRMQAFRVVHLPLDRCSFSQVGLDRP